MVSPHCSSQQPCSLWCFLCVLFKATGSVKASNSTAINRPPHSPLPPPKTNKNHKNTFVNRSLRLTTPSRLSRPRLEARDFEERRRHRGSAGCSPLVRHLRVDGADLITELPAGSSLLRSYPRYKKQHCDAESMRMQIRSIRLLAQAKTGGFIRRATDRVKKSSPTAACRE